jgi:hypothetical protein
LLFSLFTYCTRYSNELCKLYDKLDIFEVVEIGRLKWLDHLFRIQELDPHRKFTILQPEDTRRVVKPKLRWLESVEEDLKKMEVRNWRRK